MQEPSTVEPEKIRSVSGAYKRRHSSESEPEEEPSSSDEEKEEQKPGIEKSSASDVNTAEKPEEGVKVAEMNEQPAGPSVPVHQPASSKVPCKPAVFIPVDRSPEIQVGLCEQRGVGNYSTCHQIRSLQMLQHYLLSLANTAWQ